MTDELLVSINPLRVAVDPGGVAEVALQLQNRSTVVDEYMVRVLGEAAAWTTLDRSQVPIFPEGVGSVQVTMRPPRASHPEAGTIAIGFRVRSTVDPSVSVVEECRVELKPFVEIAGEVSPKTARGRFSASHQLRVINRGNAPVSVSVRAEVQQGDCQVSVPEGPLVVAAGERKTARLKVRPTSARWSGGDEMHQYRLSLEPQGGTPVALDAMMRQRPIARIPTSLLVAAALLLGGAYVVYGKGPNPLQTAMHWTGSVQASPSAAATPSSTPTAAPPSPSPTPTPSQQPTPTHAASPSPSSSPLANTTFRPLPLCLVIGPLSSVTLTDSVVGSTHTLTWKGTGGCGPFTGTITARYGTSFLGSCLSTTTATTIYTIPASNLSSGTYQDTRVACRYSYTVTLKDGSGNIATATTN